MQVNILFGTAASSVPEYKVYGGAENLALDFYTVGYRPTPADGLSAIGRFGGRPGLYTVVTHSGITLAPALGLFAAQDILTGARDALLETFSPDRPSLT